MSMQEEQEHKSTGRFLNTFVNEGPVVTVSKGKGMITSATQRETPIRPMTQENTGGAGRRRRQQVLRDNSNSRQGGQNKPKNSVTNFALTDPERLS